MKIYLSWDEAKSIGLYYDNRDCIEVCNAHKVAKTTRSEGAAAIASSLGPERDLRMVGLGNGWWKCAPHIWTLEQLAEHMNSAAGLSPEQLEMIVQANNWRIADRSFCLATNGTHAVVLDTTGEKLKFIVQEGGGA